MDKMSLLVTAIVVLSTIMLFPGTAAADDNWPDQCSNASTISTTGTFDGMINSPRDTDVFKLTVDEGDAISTRVDVYADVQSLYFGYRPSSVNPSVVDMTNATWNSYFVDGFRTATPATWEVYAENSGTMCIRIFDSQATDGNPPNDWEPYAWELRMAAGEEPTWYTNPQVTEPSTSTPPTTSASSSTIEPTSTSTKVTSDPTDSDGDGVPDQEDYAPQDSKVQDKNDLEESSSGSVPSFGIPATAIGLLIAALVILRQV